jgi:isopenicillin N synthase-like dioxygenase
MSIPVSRRLDFNEVPVIDITPLVAGEQARSTVKAIGAACRDVGFFYVRGHGVARQTVHALQHQARRYFELPLEARMTHVVDDTLRGYLPLDYRSYEGESRAATSHQEGFWIGRDAPRDASRPLDAPNRWPEAQPELRTAMINYFCAAQALSMVLIRAFALALDIAPATLAAAFARPNSRLKLNHYPPQPNPSDLSNIGVVPHSDSGAFTVLWQDDRGGLEIQSKNGDWVGAPPIDDTFVINIGNIMQIWAAGHFASTPHRVINRSGEERYSIPLFVNPDHTALISPIRGPQAGSSGTDYVTYQRSIWARTFPIAGIAL